MSFCFAMSFEAGTTVGEYILEKKIGQGSSGYVWVGTKNSIEPVVIKVIPLDGWRKLEFEREADALSKLVHPNIIKLYDSIVQDKYGILVIELLDRDLLDFLDDYTINEAEARMMFRQILAGIHHLHSNNTAHMDIKPENILIRNSDVLKIGDLGSTFNWSDKGSSIKSGKAGTSFYCAPEVKSGKPYKADKADIWSLGITLHVMMTGFWPYLGQTEKEVLSNAKKGKVDLADQHLSPDLVEFMMEMLKINPDDRPDIPTLLKHKWFVDSESNIVFTPRGAPETPTGNPSPLVKTPKEDKDIPTEPPAGFTLPELSLEGLKSPRQVLMTPRSPNDPTIEEGYIRPSPRGDPGMKQTKLSKILHNFRKGLKKK